MLWRKCATASDHKVITLELNQGSHAAGGIGGVTAISLQMPPLVTGRYQPLAAGRGGCAKATS